MGAGGQAANVAAWTASLGRPARFIGKRAADAAGRVVADELRRRGVELAGPEVEDGTGTVVSIATPEGRRAMLTDRGVALDLRANELDRDWFADCERLHLPGYSLVASPLREAAVAAARLALRVSVDLSSTTAIEAAGVEPFKALLTELGPDIVFANEDEAALVGDVEAETVVVKRGADGCVVRRGTDERAYPAEDADVVDSTGAGDAFAAGFLAGGPALALRTAARCVAKMGAMP